MLDMGFWQIGFDKDLNKGLSMDLGDRHQRGIPSVNREYLKV